MKMDKYRRARGGKAFMINLMCSCGAEILYYQKDGDGKLKRCYLNRIFSPKELEKLQRQKLEPNDIPPLTCPSCNKVVGTAITHHDGRIAFRLRPGHYKVNRDTTKK